MRIFRLIIILCWVFGMLSGCAAVGVFSTSDPSKKLQDAFFLFQNNDRPLIAERLILEAIEIYQSNNDQIGLANAYYMYGFFFKASSLEHGLSKIHYISNGFLDKSATFDNRFEKSIEYFEKARPIFKENNDYIMLANEDLNIGIVYFKMSNREAACQAFERSLVSYEDYIRQRPSAKNTITMGFPSFEDFIVDIKKRTDCK